MKPEEKLAALKAELAEIEAKLAEVPKLETRRRELLPGYHSSGLIRLTQLEIRDSAFPLWPHAGYWKRRVVAVDEKWITLRDDKSDEPRRYRREDGRRERTRSGCDTIDVAKALAIWEKHQAKGAQP